MARFRRKGTPEFRRTSRVLFVAGLATHAKLYIVQDMLPASSDEFDEMPIQDAESVDDVSTLVSVRLDGDEPQAVQHAARTAKLPLSAFIRHLALGATNPLDVRAASVQPEAVQSEISKLLPILRDNAT